MVIQCNRQRQRLVLVILCLLRNSPVVVPPLLTFVTGEDQPDSDSDGEGGDPEAGGGRPVLFRTSGNSVMYSPSAGMAPRKYTPVPMQSGNGTQIFQLDEDQ